MPGPACAASAWAWWSWSRRRGWRGRRPGAPGRADWGHQRRGSEMRERNVFMDCMMYDIYVAFLFI